jgi:phosphomannomutase
MATKEAEPEIKFGTDGWRGVMARDFTFDNVRKVAQAIADYLKALPPKTRGDGKIIIGYDRRFMAQDFAREVAREIVFMEEGQVVEKGPPAQIFASPKDPRTIKYMSRFAA